MVSWSVGRKGDVFAPTHPAPRRGGVWEGGGLRGATGASCLGSRSILGSHNKIRARGRKEEPEAKREREHARLCVCARKREREKRATMCAFTRLCEAFFRQKNIKQQHPKSFHLDELSTICFQSGAFGLFCVLENSVLKSGERCRPSRVQEFVQLFSVDCTNEGGELVERERAELMQ